MIKKLLVMLGVVIFCSNSHASTITLASVTGDVISIAGTGFGAKTTAAPIQWSNFNDGALGTTLPSIWETPTGAAPIHSNDVIRSGSTMSVLCDMSSGTAYNSSFGKDWGASPPTVQKFYVSYWRYNDVIGVHTSNFKPMRIEAYGAGLPQAFYNTYGTTSATFGVYRSDGNPAQINSWTGDEMPLETWTREEYYLDAGTLNNNDGYFGLWIDGQEVCVRSGINILIDSARFAAIVIGHYWRRDTDSGLRAYIDDVYIDNTRSRVEIGNASTFSACTHREIQPAVTWSDTGITGTFNQGSFETGDTVYFFVVDEDGIPSVGYPVTIGGEPVIANPVVEILTESGQTTTASIFTITGTATSDNGQTISGVTCSGQTVVTPNDGTWDEQVEAFTCLANLALGENVLVFIGSDGTRTGSDSVTITRTIPGEYTTRGAGFSIKGCTLK